MLHKIAMELASLQSRFQVFGNSFAINAHSASIKGMPMSLKAERSQHLKQRGSRTRAIRLHVGAAGHGHLLCRSVRLDAGLLPFFARQPPTAKDCTLLPPAKQSAK